MCGRATEDLKIHEEKNPTINQDPIRERTTYKIQQIKKHYKEFPSFTSTNGNRFDSRNLRKFL